jgi:hypothetical protein
MLPLPDRKRANYQGFVWIAPSKTEARGILQGDLCQRNQQFRKSKATENESTALEPSHILSLPITFSPSFGFLMRLQIVC